ncbi:uncharacterized protein I303_108100 [Kwoniella dejecticola CBS 10117]|uniref:Aspartate aminotransferase n=1 Tax=Kwoniella dejecticola CBS 10117 TaxID=1296121 RepID=A0A1A5ZWJ4_9TREE|nr:uncharacterized protein I303_08091 [Kwoniella dejecticola CBS 10117]OBR82177.1 hypothetical protein I303_08091 [Kwoniella dejecticola CBS 10117]
MTHINGYTKDDALDAARRRLIAVDKLYKGETIYGTFMMLSSAWTARVVAQAGWDFVIVDCEHGNIGDSEMHDSVNAVASCGASPIVRVRGTDPTLIKRALDTGAHGLMIPMINTADQAKEVVRASKFPPMGVRGQGSPFSASAHGLTTPEYLKYANRNLLTIIQIESQEGLANVEEICQVPGVDAIFIGPNDLSMSLQYYAPPNWDEPDFLAALERIHSTCRKYGVPVGILYPDGMSALARQKTRFFDIVAVGGDVKALNGWMVNQLNVAKAVPQNFGYDTYDRIEFSVPDTMFALKARYDADESPNKVNLAPGTYRDHSGQPWVLPSVKKATGLVMNSPIYNHEYLGIQGHQEFLKAAAQLILGRSSPKVASLHTSGGTGACHTGAVLLKKLFGNSPNPPAIYISDPSWENHHSVFRHAGHTTYSYPIYDPVTRSLDFESMKTFIANANRNSIFVLHACAHNPTGCDPTPEQWDELATIFKAKSHIAFFDCAYQGYASGDLERDRYSIEIFSQQGVQMLVAQSFSKNAGMYGERLGALHVPCDSAEAAAKVVDLLKFINRREVSTAPRFASDIMTKILTTKSLFEEWKIDVKTMADRLSDMRVKLVKSLIELKTPGHWSHITAQRGMFSYTGLTAKQCEYLTEDRHIYLPPSGRLSLTGLTEDNMEYVAKSLDFAVRNF